MAKDRDPPEQPVPSFSATLVRTLERALASATERRHEYATPEHLLLALTHDDDAAPAMIGAGVDLDELRAAISGYLDTELDALRVADGDDDVEPSPTSGFQRIVQRAILHVQASGREDVTGGNVLVALFSERESYAVYFLKQQDMSRLDAVSFVSGKTAPPSVDTSPSTKTWQFASGQTAPPPVDTSESEVARNGDPIDFFVSYSGADENMARAIVSDLETAGYTTFCQFKDIKPANNFVVEMNRGLERAHRFVALYSSAYQASKHCQAEWSSAYNRDATGTSGTLIPFLIAPAELGPLARQIVYTSLIGLNERTRRDTVLSAVRSVSGGTTVTGVRRRAAAMASPDVKLRGGLLDAVPNGATDKPAFSDDLVEYPELLRQTACTITDSLPGNAPPIVRASLLRYADHMAERGAQPIVGLIAMWAGAVELEFQASESDLWGSGLESVLRDFLGAHRRFACHFPRNAEREQFLSDTVVAETGGLGSVVEQVAEATDALRAIGLEGRTTRRFDLVVEAQHRQTMDVDTLPPSSQARGAVTPRRRLIITLIGFYERTVATLGGMAQIADSAAVKTAIRHLGDAIRSLSDLLR